MTSSNYEKQRKIIHVDMDCFYAAIEIRDNPSLIGKPVAVGGSPDNRGVICTCNYVAREYGIHSAMSTAKAYRCCSDLILLPVNMSKYRQAAKRIHAIFREFTDLVEPLSLDEAYLDVTNSSYFHGSATWIAKAIRDKIRQEEKLTASAGVSSNKFLAKIASGWQKPNGLFVIHPNEISAFVKNLAVDELFGVGKVTAEKLHRMGLRTCADLQKLSLLELINNFGKLGDHLYNQCRGIDHRAVQPNKVRKSLSVERTFTHDILDQELCLNIIHDLYDELIIRVRESANNRSIKNQYLKIKFNDFKQKSVEIASNEINLDQYLKLFHQCYLSEERSIRLLGIGVHFYDKKTSNLFEQPSLF